MRLNWAEVQSGLSLLPSVPNGYFKQISSGVNMVVICYLYGGSFVLIRTDIQVVGFEPEAADFGGGAEHRTGRHSLQAPAQKAQRQPQSWHKGKRFSIAQI